MSMSRKLERGREEERQRRKDHPWEYRLTAAFGCGVMILAAVVIVAIILGAGYLVTTVIPELATVLENPCTTDSGGVACFNQRVTECVELGNYTRDECVKAFQESG